MAESSSLSKAHLSPRQLSSLKGIVDALLPPLAVPTEVLKQQTSGDVAADPEAVREFWEHELSSNPDFMEALEQAILCKLHPTQSFLLGGLLTVLSTPLGCALLFGSLGPLLRLKAFPDLSNAEKTACLKKLQLSQFQEKRKIFMGLKRLICGLAFSFTPQPLEERRLNPFWPGMGYEGPFHWKLSNQEDARRILLEGPKDFRTIKNVMVQVTKDTELDVDVVIVGSGAGGSVAAATLAKAGYSVLVVEKGPYVPPHEVSNLEAESFDRMYEAHNLLTTSDGNMVILAGSTLGGGMTVNWSCCIPLPGYVREEWVNKFKLAQFEKDGEFDASQRAVMERIGCSLPASEQLNLANRVMKDGCESLAYRWSKTKQNIADSGLQENGFVCFGDRHGNKRTALVTFLEDAVNNGAQIVENCAVKQIVTGLYTASNGTQRRRALGIIGYVGEHKMTVRARKCVISAGGSLHTPCLLQQSGLKNQHIGRHLHLHPVLGVFGFFQEDKFFFHGNPMTTVCEEFEDGPERDGYGAKIECPSAHTGLAAACLQFINPVHFRWQMFNAKKLVALIILQRDSSEGKVRMSSDGCTPKIDYVVNKKDKKSMLEASKAAIRILIANGPKLVSTAHNRDEGFDVPPPSDENREERIENYLREMDDRGMKELDIGYFVAHQMGSCRMSPSPETGVVDTNGETWECDDLYLYDTSIFPTASGANPMITVLTLSHMLSTRLAKRLRHEDGKLSTDKKVSEAMDRLRQLRLNVSQAVPWTRTAKVLFGITWSAVPVLVAWMFWSPDLEFTERIGMGRGELLK